jgi:hypothetical protein
MNHSQSSSRAVLIDDTPRLAWAFLAVMLAIGLLFFFGRIGEAAPAVGAEDSGAALTTSQERDLLVAGLTNQVPAACRTDAIAYWKLDETSGTSYANSINSSHTATCSGNCPTPTVGQVNGALSFDGTDRSVNVSSSTDFDWPNNSGFSISVWVNIPATANCSGNKVFVGRHEATTGPKARWWVGCDGGTNRARLSVRSNGQTASSSVIANDTPLNNGQWNHVVAVRQNGTIQIYVNGQLKGTITDEDINDSYTTNSPVTIGYYDAGFRLNGTLDEVAIYGRALTAAEIQRQYQAGLINFGYDVDTWTVSGGFWDVGTTWYGGTPPGANDYAVVQHEVELGLDETIACLDVATDGILALYDSNDDYELTVTEAFNNYGTILQSLPVTTPGDPVEFFHITDGAATTMYRGLTITPITPTTTLGRVNVAIYTPEAAGGACTTDPNSPLYADRCFRIEPGINNAATVRLYAANPDELNGIAVGDLRPYRFDGGWQQLTGATTGTVGDFAYAQGTTTGFSFFLLGGPSVPTAVTLQSFNVTANNNLAVMGLVAALAAILLTAGLLITRRQTAVRER